MFSHFLLATMKNNLSFHLLSVKKCNATQLALNMPLWRLLAASRATHCSGASRTMTMMMMMMMMMMESVSVMIKNGWLRWFEYVVCKDDDDNWVK